MRGRKGSRSSASSALVVAALLAMLPASTAAEPDTMFLSNGDEISGWQWLRDPGGSQYGTWSFWGGGGDVPLTITFGLLATDGMNGGPGVDARAWVRVGAIESGGPGPALVGPSLLTFPNVSPPDDPVGYTTLGTVTILADELSPTMEGIWVLVERRGPTGDVLPEHLAVNRDAVTVDGLVDPEGSTDTVASPAPSATPLHPD